MNASIISIGDELLIGQIVNTNASFIAEKLDQAGFSVKNIFTVGDNSKDIFYALQEAALTCKLIIITGGLGPTNDDITKHTLCEYFKSGLKLHKPSLKNIQNIFHKRGWEISEINRKQAELPEKCKAIKNSIGTAPGMWFQKNKTHYFSMPGVPFEMKHMLCNEIIPKLLKLNLSTTIIHKTILTIGVGESDLAERIREWEMNLPGNIKLAYLPEPGIVKLRLSCYNATSTKTTKLIVSEINKLKKIIPEFIFGSENDTLQSVIGRLLINQKASLSTAESCTGGYIAHLLTSVPGSSEYFKGSVVAYHNSVKIKVLGVDNKIIIKHGAVSKEVVIAMALGVQKLLNTGYALAASGIAGPDGGTADKPVGTVWIALATPKTVFTEKLILGSDRERNIRRASLLALNLLRKKLLHVI